MNIKRKLLTAGCTAALTLTMSVTAFAANSVRSFSDVPSHHWGHTAIMNMVEKGMLAGTSAPVNGIAAFSPNVTMTRGEFIAVVTRGLYQEDLDAMENTTPNPWYAKNYKVAVENGIITKAEFSLSDMTKPMSRQEMALVLVRACEQAGDKTAYTMVEPSAIADYNTVGSSYRDAVRTAYSKGLIAGTDKKGSFAPKGTLTRAEAAAVLYRMVEPSARVTPNTGAATECAHTFVTKTKTVHHDAAGHYETKRWLKCACGAGPFYDAASAKAHKEKTDHGHTILGEERTWVVDSKPWTETITETVCSKCGAAKDAAETCAHTFAAKTKTIHHDAVGHYENVAVGTEKVIVGYDEKHVYTCKICGFKTYDYDSWDNHSFDEGHGGSVLSTESTPIYETRTKYESQWVVDSKAWDETITQYVCSKCGAVK